MLPNSFASTSLLERRAGTPLCAHCFFLFFFCVCVFVPLSSPPDEAMLLPRVSHLARLLLACSWLPARLIFSCGVIVMCSMTILGAQLACLCKFSS